MIHRSVRTLVSIAIVSALFFFFWEGHDLQQALFPFLFAVGVVAAWIAGRPLGWAVAAIYMALRGCVELFLYDFRFFHGQDFFILILAQQETILLTLILSIYLLFAGAVGWLSSTIACWLVRTIAMRFQSRSS